MGFKLNRYDPCVANKVINGKQCTICWYVVDTKTFHMVSSVIHVIEERFVKMLVTRGKEHNFIGINVAYKDNDTIDISMKDYNTECFEAFGDKVANIRDKNYLFEVTQASKLDKSENGGTSSYCSEAA